jgi:hypothetical protein
MAQLYDDVKVPGDTQCNDDAEMHEDPSVVLRVRVPVRAIVRVRFRVEQWIIIVQLGLLSGFGSG